MWAVSGAVGVGGGGAGGVIEPRNTRKTRKGFDWFEFRVGVREWNWRLLGEKL